MKLTRAFLLLSISLIGAPITAQPADAPDRDTINFVKALRNPDGGYAPVPAQPGTPVRSSLHATTAAIRAFRYFRGGNLIDAKLTAGFLEKCFDKVTGGFSDFPGDSPSVAATAVGLMGLVDLNMPIDPVRDRAVRYLDEHAKTLEDMRIAAAAFEALKMQSPKTDDWLKQIATARNPNGTFGTAQGIARATGGTAATILRLGGTLENRDAVLQALRDGQRSDGGFGSAGRDGSDLDSTYRVMRAFVMLKARPTDPAKLRGFVARCRSANGGYGVMPGQPPTAAGTYFAAIVSHWLEQSAAR